MAPRSAKAKKAADVKVSENEVPKKGRGKGKIVEAEDDEPETEVSEKAPPAADKKKRGKKANDNDQENKVEESAPPPKRGRKKNVPDIEEKAVSNGDEDSANEEMSTPAEDDADANGHTEEVQSSAGRGRKKQAKKEPVAEKTENKSGRSRRKQETIDYDESPKEDELEEKPKAAAKGRGRPKAQPKVQTPENEPEVADEEEVKDKPSAKGRKKGAGKAKAEKSEESDKEEEEKEPEEKPIEKPKKKEPKGRKNQPKKLPPKDEEDIEEEKDVEEGKEMSSSKRRKGAKKEEKAEAEPKDDDAIDDDVADTKPGKGKKVQKKAAEASTETDEEPQDTGEPTTKRRRKAAEEKGPVEERKKPAPVEDSKKKPAPKNKSLTSYEDLDFSNSSKNDNGREWNFKISSWNVDGIRAWSSKGGLDYLKHEKPDILCLQETKCSQDKLPDEVANPPGYHAYWLAGEKDGYAGVGIYTTKLAMNVQYGLQNEELDKEGRIITAEYEHFYLICTYVPNSGRKLVTLPKRLQWNEEFRKYVKELDKKKPVIICGDMNVSHNEIDLANPKTNRRNAGFTDEERSGLTELLGDGFVDTFRHLNPNKTAAYTFWTYMSNSRAKNVGWRLDYFIISERLIPFLCDSNIRDQVYGSDHCPISLFLHLSTADKPKE